MLGTEQRKAFYPKKDSLSPFSMLRLFPFSRHFKNLVTQLMLALQFGKGRLFGSAGKNLRCLVANFFD